MERGDDYRRKGDYKSANYKSAIGSYDEAIRLDPQFASAYYNRGLAYHHLGPVHAELYIQDYEEAVRLDRSTPATITKKVVC